MNKTSVNEFLQTEFLNNTLESYLWFIGILFLVILLNKLISRFLGKLFYNIFKRFADESNAEEFLSLLLKPIQFFIIIIAIAFGLGTLNFPEVLNVSFYDIPLKKILSGLIQVTIVISFTWIVMRLTDFFSLLMFKRAELTEGKLDDQLVPFFKDFIKVLIIVFALFFILGSIFKMNISSLIAGLGIGGLAVALAAKESLENLFGSFAIFLDKPFTVGDFIQVGDIIGTVERVGFRSTRIRTLERTYVTLPNRKIIESVTDNLTLRTFRRVSFLAGVTYDTNIEQIKAIVNDIQVYIDSHEKTNQEGIVGFHEFGDSSLNILVQYYAANLPWNDFIKLKEEINFKVMEIVQKHKSGFAFPTRTVHFFNESTDIVQQPEKNKK